MASPQEVRLAISSMTVPHKIKNINLNWKILNMSKDEWFKAMDAGLGNKQVTFTTGNHRHADSPYWERIRGKQSMSIGEFREKTKTDYFDNRWASYSYKDISQWPEDLRSSIDFTQLGYAGAKDVLFWLGTRGANTPCHYDTYGFNIVVQVFGSKSWLLFPPNSPLTPTRVPFEESSIYCKQNFYSPEDGKQFEGMWEKAPLYDYLVTRLNLSFSFLSDVGKKCDVYEVILTAGDVLVVPANWWHYVENLELSLTVNTWIPMEKHDAYARLEECFVRTQIEKITESDDCNDVDGLRKYIFNPNEVWLMLCNRLALKWEIQYPSSNSFS